MLRQSSFLIKRKLSAQYYTDGLGAEYLDEHLDSSSLIDVSENVSKTYSTRIDVRMVRI